MPLTIVQQNIRSMSKKSGYIIKTLIKCVIILFTTELFLQMVSYGRFVYDNVQFYEHNKLSANWYSKDKQNAWWFNESLNLNPQYHPFLGYIFRDIREPNIHIDSSGARLTQNNPQSRTGNYKTVFLFGGSTMFGYGVRDGETIPSYLAKQLNTPAEQYQVFNYGQIGYNSNQELLYLILQLKNGDIPDMVIFYDGCNDLTLAKSAQDNHLDAITGEKEYAQQMGSLSGFFHSLPGGPRNTSLIDKNTLKKVVDFAVLRIKLIHYPIQLVSTLIQRFQNTPIINKPNVETNVYAMSVNYGNNAKIIDALSQRYHFQYLLLWQPFGMDKKLTGQEASTEIAADPENAALIASASSALTSLHMDHFINLNDVFNNYADTSLYFDKCHVNKTGNAIVAERIRDLIYQREKDEK
jgi:hypothetical protein